MEGGGRAEDCGAHRARRARDSRCPKAQTSSAESRLLSLPRTTAVCPLLAPRPVFDVGRGLRPAARGVVSGEGAAIAAARRNPGERLIGRTVGWWACGTDAGLHLGQQAEVEMGRKRSKDRPGAR